MSKTENNLQEAFAGESQARNMYTFFAQVARKEGYHYIAKIFEETADNEKRHAKDHFKMLGKLGDTAANLKAAMEGEHYETSDMYPTFAKEAEEEGNMEAAMLFKMIAKVEAHHRDRYKKLLEIHIPTLCHRPELTPEGLKREEEVEWKCSVCGYVHKGTEPPEQCPCCKHPKEYYDPANLAF